MIDPVLFVVAIVFFAAGSRAFPTVAPSVRLILCCFPGGLILLYFNACSLMFALISVVVSWLTYFVCRRITSFSIKMTRPTPCFFSPSYRNSQDGTSITDCCWSAQRFSVYVSLSL